MEIAKNLSPEKVKKDLEEELKLGSDDIRSHAWFHGSISRNLGERLVKENGDFIVRDCISQPGDYVLTMRWHQNALHFIINRVVLNPDTTKRRIQYQFERESFDNIPSLIRYYVGNKKVISEATHAVISKPVNRTIPLSYLGDSKYGTITAYPQAKHHRSGSQPSIPAQRVSSFPQTMSERCESQPQMQTLINSKVSEIRNEHGMTRYGSEPLLSPKTERKSGSDFLDKMQSFGSDSQLEVKQAPPPKPSRNQPFDRDSSDYSQLVQQEPMPIEFTKLKEENKLHFISPILRARKSSDTRNSIIDTDTKDKSYYKLYSVSPQVISEYDIELISRLGTESVFKPSEFTSTLLSEKNKPLESAAIIKVKDILLKGDVVTIAKHLTKQDLLVTRILYENDTHCLSGLELLTLPHAVVFRQDLLERFYCLKLWVAVTIMTCVHLTERVAMVTKWIEIAEMLKSKICNLYGFAAVMEGLCCSQVSGLKLTWDGLRRSHTNLAIKFDTKLRHDYKCLNIGDHKSIPLTRTTIPHIIPLLQLLQRDPSSVHNQEIWEKSTDNHGLDSVLIHLDAARCYAQQSNLYKINAETELRELNVNDELQDCLKTEFHLRILWGIQGTDVCKEERYGKFNRILTVMADRIEPLQTL
ncbi:SH2 domain-containing protein 3C-like [Saccoglossus kowalevskii]|uniref:SH2 domain-containing protein 3C-like n=1 Tax=Saccoglossus kowalevskii TaxID=10224 RepID=A0ABM0LVN0_SACKO|nr:PREDICTED: SH2 domain-containing protein 3C-like [Saccoglossus kowalevskii]